MKYISVRIGGVPYGKSKTRGDQQAPKRWTEAVIDRTKMIPQIPEACLLKVTFLLPPDKFPSDFPYGPDLDNLLKRLLDALNETIFRDAPGGDSCVVSLAAMKTRVDSAEEAGVHLEVLPISIQ